MLIRAICGEDSLIDPKMSLLPASRKVHVWCMVSKISNPKLVPRDFGVIVSQLIGVFKSSTDISFVAEKML